MWLFGRDLSWQTTKSANSFGKGSRQNGSRPLWQYHWLLLQAIEVIEISFSSNQNRLIHLSFQVWRRRKGNFAQIVPKIVAILGRRIEKERKYILSWLWWGQNVGLYGLALDWTTRGPYNATSGFGWNRKVFCLNDFCKFKDPNKRLLD